MKFWVVQKEKNSILAVKLKKKGQEIILLEGPKKVELRELKGQKVIGACKPKDFYFSRETFPKTKKEILTLQIQDKLQELGLFEQTPIVRYRNVKEIGGLNEYEIVAVNELGIKECFEELINKEIKPEKIIPEELSIAFLTIRESEKFLISIYITEDKLWIFITGRNEIFYYRNIEIDSEFGITEELLEEAILTTIDYAQRILKIEIEGIIKYGKNRNIIPKTAIPEYEPKLIFIKNVSKEEIKSNPILFGSYYVAEEFNFIPEEQISILKSIKIASYIAYFLAVCIIVNYILWIRFENKVKFIENENRKIKKEIYEQEKILNKLITPEKKETLEKVKEILTNYQKTLKLNIFLTNIENIKPHNSEILLIEGKNNKKEETKNQSQENNDFEINIKIKGKGNLEELTKNFEKFNNELRKFLNITEDRYLYLEKTREGFLEIKGYYHGYK